MAVGVGLEQRNSNKIANWILIHTQEVIGSSPVGPIVKSISICSGDRASVVVTPGHPNSVIFPALSRRISPSLCFARSLRSFTNRDFFLAERQAVYCV